MEEVAALHTQRDAMQVVADDTQDRLRMCIAEIRRLNNLLNAMEENLITEQARTAGLIAQNNRAAAELQTLRSMTATMRRSLDRYRSHVRQVPGHRRVMPVSFRIYLDTRRREENLDEHVQRIRRRLDFENIEAIQPDEEDDHVIDLRTP